MRWILSVVAVVTLAALCPPDARAHGGRYGRHPGGPPPGQVPTLPCDCARVACEKCSAPGLAAGEGLGTRTATVDILEHWGDLCRVRAIVTFATDVEPGVREAFAPVSHGPLLAITGGSVTANEQRLLGELRSGREGRRDYIWERDRRKRDPLLVLRHDAHTVHLRVFPVAKNIRVTAVVEGFSLCPPTGLPGVRLYRTGPHYLAIVPLDHPAAVAGGADLTDEAGGRALLLLDRSRCRALFPDAWEDAREVPAVTALGQVLLGRGPAAVTNDTVLVALPAGSRAPRDLFVGPRARAPFTDTPLPPPVTDPTPPPPLPSVPPPPVSPTSAGAPSGADPTASD